MDDANGNDWALADQVRTGSDAAFDALLARYRRPVLHFVYRMLGDAAEAEDVAQDVFVRAYHGMRRPGFHRTRAAFSSWLFQIARHAALDRIRYRRRHPAEPLSALADDGAAVRAAGRSASEELVDREVGEQIAAAVADLPEDQRAALVLAEYADMPTAGIAAAMRCSPKSVEARLYRARRFLRERLAHLLRE